MGALADFAVFRPWLEAAVVFDMEKGNIESTPWLTCRQCRRKEKGALISSRFSQASKLAESWSSAIILENAHTAGYPVPFDGPFDPINQDFPIRDHDWRDPSLADQNVSRFWKEASQPFSLLQARRVAFLGNDLIQSKGDCAWH